MYYVLCKAQKTINVCIVLLTSLIYLYYDYTNKRYYGMLKI